MEEHKVKVQTVIHATMEALKDDFELVTKAESLLADLEGVRNFPSHIDIGSCGSPRYMLVMGLMPWWMWLGVGERPSYKMEIHRSLVPARSCGWFV